uniref:Uncharacterized protein n=1 Tax=viral metagenome TaxID=1070528 RepID=A0A6C0H3R2_9ZZZZ
MSLKCKYDSPIRKTGCKNIVFQETNIRLENAVSFSQYIIGCNKLVTLIGERHGTKFKCKPLKTEEIKTISKYCVEMAEKNPKCRVILEYYCGGEKVRADVPSRMNSHSIKSTFNDMKDKFIDNQILPLDYRPAFLSRDGQDDLYGKGWSKYKKPEEIKQNFILPFWKESDKFSMNNPHLYPSIVNKFLELYYQDICITFKKINDKLSKNKKYLLDVRQDLFDAWKLVADYFIIRKILKNDDIDEFILIIGEAHRENINILFDKLKPFVIRIGDIQLGKSGKCVKLFETHKF